MQTNLRKNNKIIQIFQKKNENVMFFSDKYIKLGSISLFPKKSEFDGIN
jgi:hypothetical protein